MIGVQRQLKKEGKNYRAFEILNLGKYERQHYIGVNPNLREREKQKQIEKKEKDFIDLILSAYKAEKIDGLQAFHGKKGGRLVAIGPVNLPVSRLFVDAIIVECREKHFTKVDILGFEFEMGLFPNVLDDAKARVLIWRQNISPSRFSTNGRLKRIRWFSTTWLYRGQADCEEGQSRCDGADRFLGVLHPGLDHQKRGNPEREGGARWLSRTGRSSRLARIRTGL